MTKVKKVEIALDQPLEQTFTYLLPDNPNIPCLTGMRVLVPLGKRKVTGYILGQAKEEHPGKLKTIEAFLDQKPLFNENMLSFFRWISTYYQVPLGEVIKSAMPAGINTSSFKSIRLHRDNIYSKDMLSDDDKRIIAWLDKKEETKLSDFKKRFSRSKDLSSLYRLENKGFISLETKISKSRVKEKKACFVTLSSSNENKNIKISPRAREIINFIKNHGEVSLAFLLRELSTSHGTVKRLKEKEIIVLLEKEVYRDPFCMPVGSLRTSEPGYELNASQNKVMKEIGRAVSQGGFTPFLLEGKTGSGKTEIYLQTIEKTGGNAIVLIPEISLTPQLTTRFRERFGDRVAILHSGLSPGERYDQWRRIRDETYDIVVGARSAIFAPLKKVKAIIVDEEHEPSYKQEDGIRYNARDLALVRGKIEKALIILGSATPSLESVNNASEGKFTHLILPERVNNLPLPDIEIVDMRKTKKEWLSPRLKVLIRENLEKGEQTLLFLNRRGFSPFVLCYDCGQDFKCPHCSVSLTWHRSRNELTCHYCDYTHSSLPACPSCNGLNVKGVGMGTEQIEQNLMNLFEDARIARMDRDSIRGKGALDKMLHSFTKGDYDIMVGTQMIAKGHHFPGVTLVGVILADLSLNIPDFRAAERTYQLLTQVAGRAGRGNKKGKVIIQTFNPDHYSILHGGEKDSETFYTKEMSIRKEFLYPPCARLVIFRIWGSDAAKVEKGAIRLKSMSETILKKPGLSRVEILGPAPAPLSRLKGKSRWQMLARSVAPAPIHQFSRILMEKVKEEGKHFTGLKIIPDFDPYNMM